MTTRTKTSLAVTALVAVFALTAATSLAAQDEGGAALSEVNLSALELRNIGPAINGGRIADIDIHPEDPSVWYVAVGSGGVWKTVNAGTTWTPIFDDQPSYSIGSVAIDPSDPSTVWVGTGENVGGRHVGFGDGVYRTTDGGRTWENMGLERSEHISTMIVHPEDSDVVWVSAQGPLWTPGDERGLYKTTDRGQTWRKVLGDDEWVGVTDIVMDPRDPDVLYAATWQRHRTVAALLGGGPGSGIHKSTDGGETWRELTTGLPSSTMGKIGLAISPQDPDIVYAAIELERREGGVFRSTNRGESWTKMSDAVSGGTGPHYYQELYASPHRFGRLYLVSNVTQISDDHGASFRFMDLDTKHSDDHAIAFHPSDPDYLLVGSDGGLYETYDDMETWRFLKNLPVMQYYKISVDDAEPFYHVFGGTQDNGSNGGPSRTDNNHGIRNADWFKTLGADGHDSATEPGNPNIIYAETQQGGLHRIDRITGDQVFIQPQAREGEGFERYNWDAPIEISPHSPTRIYFASQRVWRTDDRGDSWTPISGDLTRNQERIELPIMGGQQSWDNAWDVGAMSNYNTITSLGESPLVEGLLYAGTDDGLLQVTEDGGETWRRIEVGSIPGIPATAFVNDIKADLFDENTVYVALDNHKYGDFAPYLVKSTDRGRSWTSIAGDLPDRHLVWRVVQDHVEPNLMFAATEFGVFFTIDGGSEWRELEGGAPTISFRDIDIQRDHEDLVAGSFGRGIFILDDYTPLRELSAEALAREGTLFPIRTAYWYVEDQEADSQGDDDYRAENPPFGAVFTYYLRDGYQSMEAERKERERALEEGEDVPFPGWDVLEAEMRERGPTVQVVVRDPAGTVIDRVDGPTSAGVHRVAWDLRHSPKGLVGLGQGGFGGGGFLALPGDYTATLIAIERGETTELSDPVGFEVVPLEEGALTPVSDEVFAAFREEVEAFQQDLARTDDLLDDQLDRVRALQTSLDRAEGDDPELRSRLEDTRIQLLELREAMNGSEAKGEIGERSDPTPSSRLFVGFRGLSTTYGPTELHRRTIEAGRVELADIRAEVDRMAGQVVPALEQAVEAAGGPPVEGDPPMGD
ncbi:MAG: glycosyl hydrolase [Gemmatimonadota bacterium]|nr:glycosyl hydrolase [Gemmatimonadota bacterium]